MLRASTESQNIKPSLEGKCEVFRFGKEKKDESSVERRALECYDSKTNTRKRGTVPVFGTSASTS